MNEYERSSCAVHTAAKRRDVLAYHLRQSFKPGEIDPATANQIGFELAMKLTRGNHAFVCCTHVDKAHIHSHIIFNSTSLDCTKKFRNFKGSSFAIRRISDQLCVENGLSIIEKPKPSKGKDYGDWLGGSKPWSLRNKLEQIIDYALEDCNNFNSFLAAMQGVGCEIKQGKHLAFKAPGQKRFIRRKSLGDDYTEDAIRERLAGTRAAPVCAVSIGQQESAKINLLIDIQQKIQQARTPGFERFAKVYNLKEVARTLIFLQEQGLTDYDDLEWQANASSDAFHACSAQIKALESRMVGIAELQKHIGNYTRTLDVFRQYKASGYSKKFYEMSMRSTLCFIICSCQEVR